MNCQYCDKEVKNKNAKSQHELYCLLNPERKIRESGFKGKKHTDESKEKNRQSTTQQWKDGLKTLPEAFYEKRPQTDETKSKISKSMLGNNNANHRGDRQSYYKNIRMDSKWEVATAEYLESQNIKFIYGEIVFYLDDSTYRPDFYLPEFDSFIEVKGFWREKNLEKFFKFKIMYRDIKIEVWDKDKLKELKII